MSNVSVPSPITPLSTPRRSSLFIFPVSPATTSVGCIYDISLSPSSTADNPADWHFQARKVCPISTHPLHLSLLFPVSFSCTEAPPTGPVQQMSESDSSCSSSSESSSESSDSEEENEEGSENQEGQLTEAPLPMEEGEDNASLGWEKVSLRHAHTPACVRRGNHCVIVYVCACRYCPVWVTASLP